MFQYRIFHMNFICFVCRKICEWVLFDLRFGQALFTVANFRDDCKKNGAKMSVCVCVEKFQIKGGLKEFVNFYVK